MGIGTDILLKVRMTGIFSLIQKYRVTTMKTVETMTIPGQDLTGNYSPVTIII